MARNLREGCAEIGCRSLAAPSSKGDAGKAASDPGLASAVRLRLEAPRRTWFAIAAGSYAVTLALLALWLLSSALIRPTIAFPPVDAAAAQAAASQTSRAYAAALIGVLRGELWADYAFALASVPIREFEDAKTIAAPRSIEPARSAARRAAELSPHDLRVWLLLAALDSQNERFRSNVSEELKTSYYTGPNEDALRPLRIRVALAFDAIADPELQSLVTMEIQTIIAHAPALKPSIIAAYLHGSAAGRRFLEDEAPKLDPELLDVLHKADQAQ